MKYNPLKYTNIKLINTKLLVLISFVLVFIGALPFEAKAVKASFYVSPERGSYGLGERFNVKVMIDTDGAPINAAQATVYFSVDKLKVLEVSKSGSIFNLWPEEIVYSNSEGKITFVGGLPSPGYTGESGKLFTVVFQGKAIGEAKVYFQKEAILANDARGTNIFSFSKEGIYSIVESREIPPEVKKLPPLPKVYSPTHPRPDKWYSNNNPILKWDLPAGVDGVSTVFNQEFVFDVPAVSEGLLDSKSYTDVKDGIWYFHIRFRNKDGWGEISRFRVQIDTQSPHPFEIRVDNEGDATNPRPILYFEAKDDTSGINHYDVKIGEGEIFSLLEVQVPFRMSHQNPGIHSVEIKAIDNAGNSTVSTSEVIVESIPSPEINVCPNVFISGEEVLHIEGTSAPNQKVIIFLNKDGKLIKKWEVVSNEKGNWVLEEEGLLRSGIYKISARTENNKGAISNPSPECTFKVVLSGIAVGPWVLRYQCISLLALLILIILLIILFYLLSKVKREHRYIERESRDLKQKFYKEYEELREDIKLQLEMFKKAKEQRGLTKEEKDLEKRLWQDFEDIEEVLEKELADIEKI